MYFEDEPEYDHEMAMEAAPFSEPIHNLPDPLARRVEERHVDTRLAGVAKSSGSSRRSVLLAVVLAAILSLALLTAYFVYRATGPSTERERVTSADPPPTSHTLSSDQMHENQAAVEKSAREAGLEPDRIIVGSGSSPAPAPAKLESGLSQVAPDMQADNGSPGLSEQVDPVGVNELASTGISVSGATEMLSSELPASGGTAPTDLVSAEGGDTESSASGVAAGPAISVNFPFDSDALGPEAQIALDQAVAQLQQNPESIADITGFTDNQGDEGYNLMLSRKRADAVKRYLVAAGVAQERLRVEGRGALTDVAVAHGSDEEDALGPFRVVQIELSGDRAQ